MGTAPKEGEQTTIKAGGASLAPVTLDVAGGTDLGLFLIGDPAQVIDLVATNNSNLPITGLSLTISDTVTAGMTFNPDLGGARNFPGYLGDCTSVLAANSSCTMTIFYNPLIQGAFTQDVTFSYSNIIETKTIDASFTLQAGEPASLIFTDEKTTYDFGVKERKDCVDIIYQPLEIKNAGGLPATNLVFTMLNTPSASIEAYKIFSNNCPSELDVGATCNIVVSFQPQNWGDPQDCDGDTINDVAPDLDTYEVNYNGQLRGDFTRDPLGGIGSINGYFTTLSTTIEGRIEVSGLPDINFDDPFLVGGQKTKKTIKISNFGFKEAILRSVHVRQGGVHIATCIKDFVGTAMECRDASDASDSSNKLSKDVFPLHITDINSCFDLYTYMGYGRNPDGSLTVTGLKEVGGIPEGGNAGESCFLDIHFEPSVNQIADANFADPDDFEFVIEYDTTWKNLLDPVLTLRGEIPLTDPATFQVLDAISKAPARMYFTKFNFDSNDIIASNNKVIQYKSNTFNEKASDDGSIYNAIYLELVGDTFTWETSGSDEILTQGTKFNVVNLPPGVGIQIKKVSKDFGQGSADHAEISLTGAATSHGAANSINNMEISFENAAFTTALKGEVFHSEKTNLSVKFIDSYADFSPDPGDPELDIFLDLGRIALVNSTAYTRSIGFEVKNSGSQAATITSVKDGKGASLSAGVYPNMTEPDGVYYQSAGYDNNIISSGFATGNFIMALNPIVRATAAMEFGLLHDVNSGVDIINKYKKFEIEYDDGADFNDDGTARRKQKINVHWSAVLVKKGFLVIEDTGDTFGSQDVFLGGNVNTFDLKLTNDGTGPVTHMKLRSGFDDLFSYYDQSPLSFIDDTTCDAPACKDCFEILKDSSSAWPGPGILDCAGADDSKCLNAGESCIMKVESRIANAKTYGAPYANISAEKTRDYSLANELGSSEKNWEFNFTGGVSTRTISVEYLDGDYAGRTDEDIPDFGDIQTISGAGALSTGEYAYEVRFRKHAVVHVDAPQPLDSAVIYRQPITLGAITSDAAAFSDVASTTIPSHFLRFSTAENEVNRSFESPTHVSPLITGADEAAYEWVFHGGTFPFDGSTYNMSFTLNKVGNVNAKNVVLNYTGPGNLTHSFSGTYSLTNFNSIIVVNLQYTPGFAGETVLGELEFTYENQLIESGSPVSVTKKIKIMASSSAVVTPSLSSQEQDASLVPFGPVSNYNLKYNALSAESDYYKDIKGGGGISHRYTVTNNSGTESMKALSLYIKTSTTASSADSSLIGHQITYPAGIPCRTAGGPVTLGPGDSCEFDLAYTALDNDNATAPHERYLFLNYAIDDNQFITSQVQVDFEPAEPAIVIGRNWPSLGALSTRSVVGFYPDPYAYSYGTSVAGTHITVSQCAPMENKNKTLLLRNDQVEKASLLRAYRCNKCAGLGGFCKQADEQCWSDATTVLHDTNTFRGWDPSGAESPVEVYSKADGSMTVTAERECLYGPSGDPPGQGFGQGDGDICQIHVNWTLNKDQFGKQTIDQDNAFSLEFYSSQLNRRPQDAVGFVFRAFVEPNPVNHVITGHSNVTTDSSGTATFTFNQATPDDTSCGVIDGYRLFYSDTASLLSNIWSSGASFVDLPKTGSTETVTVPGLNPGSHYYFKVVGKRTFAGTQYLSDSNLNTLGVVVPPVGTHYDHAQSLIFDDYIIPKDSPPSQYFSPAEAIAGCNTEEYSLRKNGGNTALSKVLITEAMWDHVLTDPGFTSYAGGDPWIFPHWLNEAPRFIGPYFPSYDCSIESTNTPDNEYAYTKAGDCAADDSLPLLVGKNLLILPFKYNFIEPNGSFYGYARCYAPVNVNP